MQAQAVARRRRPRPGKATINELQIVKRVDSASTALMSALRTNEPIQKAVLTLRKAGKSQLEYLKITIEQGRVIVARRSRPAIEPAAPDVVERVSFSFNKIDGRVHAAGQGRLRAGRHDVRGPVERPGADAIAALSQDVTP